MASSSPSTGARRRSLMPWLVGALVVVPIVETWVLIQVGHAIGGWNTIGILVLEAVLGAWLMRREGSRTWGQLRGAVSRGSVTASDLSDAALVLVGGLMLMLPGFLTDVVGLVCLLPFTRPFLRSLVDNQAQRQLSKVGLEQQLRRHRGDPSMDVQGEVVDEPAPRQSRRDEGQPPAITGTVI